MSDSNHFDDLPADLRDVAGRIHESRTTYTAVELDAIKQRAMNQAARRPTPAGRRLVSRWVTVGLAAAILGGTAGTGLAEGGSFFGKGDNAAVSQYKPEHRCHRWGSPWPYGDSPGDRCRHERHHRTPPAPPPPPHHDSSNDSGNSGTGTGDSSSKTSSVSKTK
jgi:hypothetical protein